MRTNILNLIAFILLVIGGINWALIAAFQFDVVASIFGTSADIGSRIVYGLVGLSAIWLTIVACMDHGKIDVDPTDNM